MTPELVDSLNLAASRLGRVTCYGSIVWMIRRMYAEIRDVHAKIQQLRGEDARKHDALMPCIDWLSDSRIE